MERGLFAVFKPPGLTSAAVTNTIRNVLDRRPLEKRTKPLKVGHGGTLDRLAEGVLVIGVAEGCQHLKEYLEGSKEYDAIGYLGKTTDTLDADGQITQEKSYGHVTESLLRNTLASFVGEQTQVPPLYSALRQNGRRLSHLMRMGEGASIDLERKRRTVTIYKLRLLCVSLPTFRILVECSSGTYIRSLVRDIGDQLGTVAYLQHLCRTRQGQFYSNEALRESEWTFDKIQSALQCSALRNHRDN